MAIARWTPFDQLTNLHTTMDRLFGDLVEGGESSSGTSMTLRLPVDISETENAYIVKAPVPGFRPEDVEVTVTGNVLTINATRKESKEDKKGNYIRREMVAGNFMRQIGLPTDARPDNVDASFDNGVLTIEVPRTPRPQPKRIEVKAQGQRQMAGAGASSNR